MVLKAILVIISLVAAKLVSEPEYEALSSVSTSRVQAWMLNRMAHVKQENANQRVWMQSAFLQPLAILLFASGVLWICYSFFNFLSSLIYSLAL